MGVQLGVGKAKQLELNDLRQKAFPRIFTIRRGKDGFYLVLHSDKARELGITWPARRWKNYPGGQKPTTNRQEAIKLSREITFSLASETTLNRRKSPRHCITIPRA